MKLASVPKGVDVVGGGMMTVRKGSGGAIPRNTGGPGTDDPGRIHYPLITVKELLQRAWDSYYEIESPGWADTQVVNVEATMPPETTGQQFKEMLRHLIIDRFGLKYHTGTKEVPGYALSLAKSGPKMKESLTQNSDPHPGAPITQMSSSAVRMNGHQATIKQLIEVLQFLLQRTAGPGGAPIMVTDSTGLTAKYDFKLEFSPGLVAPGTTPDSVESLPDIFAAVQSQLGLKLERKKVPAVVMVVDRMDKTPKAN